MTFGVLGFLLSRLSLFFAVRHFDVLVLVYACLVFCRGMVGFGVTVYGVCVGKSEEKSIYLLADREAEVGRV